MIPGGGCRPDEQDTRAHRSVAKPIGALGDQAVFLRDQVGSGWQQPVTQKKPAWQDACPASPHFCLPAGQTCSVQSAGKVVLPAQSSQCSQVLLQAAFCVQGLHFD